MRAWAAVLIVLLGLAACGYRTPLQLPPAKGTSGKPPPSSTAPELPESERP